MFIADFCTDVSSSLHLYVLEKTFVCLQLFFDILFLIFTFVEV